MRFAIIVITYSSPAQTLRMVQRFSGHPFDFYIHVDKKVDLDTHKELFDVPNVFFVKDRIDIKWAGFTTVEAALNSIKCIAESGRKYDFINLITGQDYPIKSASYIANFLAANKGREFMHFKDFETEWQEANARVDKYHFTDMTFKGRYVIQKVLNKVTPKRKFPLDVKLYGKETFWTLSQECATYVLDTIESNARLKKFLRFTWGSDEFIFQTIIMGSPFKENVVNKNYRCINWPQSKDGPSIGDRPNFFVADDFDRIMASDGLFGRKFDINRDAKIFDLLDNANNH